jgi:hypothetical protein
LAVWLFGCLAVWLFGCLAVWLFGCLAVWLFGCLAAVALGASPARFVPERFAPGRQLTSARSASPASPTRFDWQNDQQMSDQRILNGLRANGDAFRSKP